MRTYHPILLSVTVLLIVSLACTVSAAPTQDINALGTAVMETMIAGATQTARGIIPVDIVGTPTATFTPVFTPTETVTPSPAFTATSIVPQVSVSVATNCRTGPGKVYERVGALLVGQVAEVVGRNYDGNYWYIRNPSQSGGFCWLWGEYATLTGNFAALPAYTPPPTPTPMPAFEASYAGLEGCAAWWVDLEVTNTGGIAFESISITIRDTVTDVVESMYADVFEDLDGCSESSAKDTLNVGATRIVSAPAFDYDPSEHKLRATITLCSRDGQNGTCITDTIKFTP
jgi:hypothetical protein